MVAEEGEAFFHALFCVEVAADEPEGEEEEDGGEDAPFDYYSFLGWGLVGLMVDGRASSSVGGPGL